VRPVVMESWICDSGRIITFRGRGINASLDRT
jgi:hypothetical protein